MAIIRKSQIREMNAEEISKKEQELDAEIVRENMSKHSTGKPSNPGRLRALRRTRATLLTILAQRKKPAGKRSPKNAASQPPKAPAAPSAGKA